MKTCKNCRRSLPQDDFYKKQGNSDGRRSLCKTCHRAETKIWKSKNREQERANNANWYKNNNDIKKQQEAERRKRLPHYWRDLERTKRKTDVNFRLRQNLRARIGHAIKRGAKVGSAVGDLGCTISELKQYLESKWQPGMTWDNWSTHGWHIDHITPLASFDLTDPEQLRTACNYTNLQPLWAEDNLSKGDRICMVD